MLPIQMNHVPRSISILAPGFGANIHPAACLVFRFWQCDKENHGWREGPPLTVPCQSFDPLAEPSPSGKVSFEQK